MFDHVSIAVADFERSRAFYEAVFKTLGYGVVLEIAGSAVGFGPNTNLMFEIGKAGADGATSRSVHVAFSAGSEDAVRAFHATALAHGATDHGGPGLRPQYEPGYFAAFVIDLNGHNLEAVHHIPA